MPTRDPGAADRNARPPEGHPDAHVSVDQSTRLVGVQPAKYPAPPEPEPVPPAPEPVESSDPDPVEADTEGNSQPQADAIPDGEVVPDAEPVDPDAPAMPEGEHQ